MSKTSEHFTEDETFDGESGIATISLVPGHPLDVYVENPNGDVVIRGVDRDDFVARWHKHGRPGSPWFDEADVNVRQVEGNRIEVRVSLPPVWPGGDFGRSVLKFLEGGLKGGSPFAVLSGGRVSFDLEIDLPRAAMTADPARVRVRTANGDVRIEDVNGTIDVATANGEVVTSTTRGEVSIHAANGDLTLERPTGRVTARTVSGDLSIRGGELARFTLTTVNGDANVETALTGDSSRIESVNGDVRLDLTLPAATGGTLSVRSVSGDADVAPPFRSVAKRTWRIGPGTDGGPSVGVKTVSGDLQARGTLSEELKRSANSVVAQPPAPPDPPTAPPPPAPPAATVDTIVDPRLAILKAVERGELDIDEAMRRLDAAGSSG
ncbi:MAG: hypothetical protein QOJ59_834 [Thermomicrobiales bacterium]|jgi:hypothetical protein|nr:hypothetical protein [Thermomicrobiales bacterium]